MPAQQKYPEELLRECVAKMVFEVRGRQGCWQPVGRQERCLAMA
jgi:hypothetical protein